MNKLLLMISVLAAVVLAAMLFLTSPSSVGPVGVLVFFTMIFIALFGLMVELVKVFQKILKDKNGKGGEISENKTYMYATVLAFGPIILLVTRSANIFTVALVGIFVFLGCFLIRKRA